MLLLKQTESVSLYITFGTHFVLEESERISENSSYNEEHE
jgi:hypothetical protein